jgi:hypothetical protein
VEQPAAPPFGTGRKRRGFGVRSDGTIGLGWSGDLKVAGLTRLQVKSTLVLRLRRFVTDEALVLSMMDESGRVKDLLTDETDRLSIDDEPDLEPPSLETRLGPLEEKFDRVLAGPLRGPAGRRAAMMACGRPAEARTQNIWRAKLF